MTTNEERDVLELAEMIGNHVAAEYEDDPGLDGLILELRAATKPRTVTTRQQQDALPVGSVILDASEDIMGRGTNRWRSITDPDEEWVNLPATILFTPTDAGSET